MAYLKRRTLLIILVGLLVMVPFVSKAATMQELQSQINALLEQVRVLQQQLAMQQGNQGFQVGARVEALTNLKIRQGPSTEAAVTSTASRGAQGTIINCGPQTCPATANGYSWWNIDWDSSYLSSGWSAQGTTEADFLKIISTAPTSPSITLLSPSGGEVWQKGSMQTIRWRSSISDTSMVINLIQPDTVVALAHLKGCSTSFDRNSGIVQDWQWQWRVGYDIDGRELANGNYRILIYNCGNIQDISDSSFSIVTGTTLTPLITSTNAKAAGNFEMDAGGSASIYGSHLSGNYLSTTKVFIGGMQATVTYASDNLVNISVPSFLVAGQSYDLYISNEKGTSNVVKIHILSNITTANQVKIVDGTTYGSNGDAFIMLSIQGNQTNKQIHHWVLGYWCLTGVTLDTGKGFSLLCDGIVEGKSGLSFYASNIYDVTSDYLMITAGAQNKNTYPIKLTFTLEARDASDKTLSSDTKIIPLNPSLNQHFIQVLSPNGGEMWPLGSTQTIRWSSTANVPIVDITTTNVPGTYIASSIPNTGSYTWTISSNFPTGQYRLRIAEPTGGLEKGMDDSNASFNVRAISSLDPSCTLTTNKSSYQYGEPIVFSWTSQNATYAAFQQDTFGRDNIWLPGDKLNASGSYSATASVIGNHTVTLLIYNYYSNNSCSVTIPVSQ